jgi:hypothetical protein
MILQRDRGFRSKTEIGHDQSESPVTMLRNHRSRSIGIVGHVAPETSVILVRNTQKQPKNVQGHDFPGPEVPRAYPYGIYDLGRNAGFVNVGTDHDTGEFAVASIRGWWRVEGRRLYPGAATILITADGGGSNGSRLRLWKLELQKFADQTGLCLSVCHFPPGTSKWNKIEHRLFSFITSNWRGEPLRDYETIVNLIAGTTTAKGLKVTCRLDRRKYPTGRTVSDEEMKRINVERNKFHGDWNYVIRPKAKDMS